VKGNLQLFSVDAGRSQALEAHAASFAKLKVRPVPPAPAPRLVLRGLGREWRFGSLRVDERETRNTRGGCVRCAASIARRLRLVTAAERANSPQAGDPPRGRK